VSYLLGEALGIHGIFAVLAPCFIFIFSYAELMGIHGIFAVLAPCFFVWIHSMAELMFTNLSLT